MNNSVATGRVWRAGGWFFLLPFLSAALAIISYPPQNVGGARWVFLVPLLFFASSGVSRKTKLLFSYLAGIIFYGVTLKWLFATLPLSWAGIDSVPSSIFFVTFFWFSLSLILALTWLILSASAIFIKKKALWITLMLPSVWALGEYITATGIGIFWAGTDTLIGPHWLFGSIADTIATAPRLLQITNIGGWFFASFFIVLINTLIFLFLQNSRNRKNAFLIGGSVVVLFSAATLYGARALRQEHPAGEPLTVALVQTNNPSRFNIDKEAFQDQWNRTRALLKKAAAHDPTPDIFVLPEDARFFLSAPLEAKSITNALIPPDQESVFIDSGRKEREEGGAEHIITYLNSSSGLMGYYNKTFLVPNGEYVPYVSRTLWMILGKSAWLKKFSASREYHTGEKLPRPIIYRGVGLGTMSCSAVFSPTLYRDMAHDGANILINAAGQVLFQKDSAFIAQVEAKARIHAASLSRPYIQASNGGFSWIISHNGQIMQKTNSVGNTVLIGDVVPQTGKTLFARYGNWIVFVALLITSLLSLKTFIARKGAVALRKRKA